MSAVLIAALTDLGMPDLAAQSRAEAESFRAGRPHDDRYAIEIFSRAVGQRDEQAWEALYRLYHEHVVSWCRRNGATDDNLDELVNATWAKFWQHYTTEKLASAGTLAGILTYLRMCARSVTLDEERSRIRTSELDTARDVPDEQPAAEDRLAGREQAEALLQRVAGHLRDERERVLFVLTYQTGLRPAEIQRRRPDLFADVAEVYRLTRNILDRLRRDPAFRDRRSA